MEPWTGAQHGFAVKEFYKNSDSLVITQREFRRELGIHRNCAVPSAHAIKTWVRNFEAACSTLKKKGGCIKFAEHWLQTARVTQSSDTHNGVDPFTTAMFLGVRTVFTQPPFFFSAEPVASKF
jgi:hypothetical protein